MLAIFSTPLAGRDLTSGPNATPWNTATEATTTGCQNQPESPLTAGHQRAPGASERVLSQPEDPVCSRRVSHRRCDVPSSPFDGMRTGGSGY